MSAEPCITKGHADGSTSLIPWPEFLKQLDEADSAHGSPGVIGPWQPHTCANPHYKAK